jgi:hypothetical protein
VIEAPVPTNLGGLGGYPIAVLVNLLHQRGYLNQQLGLLQKGGSTIILDVLGFADTLACPGVIFG